MLMFAKKNKAEKQIVNVNRYEYSLSDTTMANLEYIWERSVKVFPILENSLEEPNDIQECDIKFVIDELVRLHIAENIYETIWLNIDYVLRHQIVPKFWKHFNAENDNENGFYQFQLSIYELHQEYEKFQRILQRIQPMKSLCNFSNQTYRHQDDLQVFKNMLKIDMLSQLPANFTKIVHSFYHISFNVFANSHQDNDVEMVDEVKCNGCNKETDSCRCQELVCGFNKTNQYLYDMDLLDRLAGFTLTNLIQERIDTHVQDTCKGVLDTSHITELLQWLDTVVLNWLTRIYNQGSLKIETQNARVIEVLKEFRVKLEYYLYETYAHIIIDQFFNVIIDFPDSKPAIDDLKMCLQKIDLRVYLVKSLKEVLEKRLLHPGVNTKDILTGYVAAIKTIRHLDSTGVLLETITEPVKQYMRSRQDTVRCVASALTDEGPTDLAEELARSECYMENLSQKHDDWENWNPDPIDASTKHQKPTSRSADIISMVIDIYGSKDIFVTEYRNLLADRLLSQLEFNPTREIRNLELLKTRFDESMLLKCHVMLKDITDSKRINSHIQTTIEKPTKNVNDFQLSTLILSSEFWPQFKGDTLELPSDLKAIFDGYTKSYEAYKGNRTLCWRPSTGRVELEIEIGNKRLELTVSPVHAVIINEFQKQSSWRLDALSRKLQIPASVVRKKITYWQAQGLIEETSTDEFLLIENFDQAPGQSTDGDRRGQQVQQHEIEDDENESAMTSANDQREEELQVFWSYIVGMLTNLDSMPLERIHQLLRMFASHGPGVEFSQDELKHFLQRKVREHALIFTAGVYQLPK